MLRSTRAAALAAAAALGMAVLVAPSAQAATKTVTIWTDEERGPVLRKLLGNKSPVPG